MRLRTRLSSLVVALAVAPGTGGAQTTDARWAPQITEARAAIEGAMAGGAAPAAAVAVAVDGEVVWSQAFGDATPDSRFGIGSISKALTLAAVMRLVDSGALDLDEPVERYLPDWPHAGQAITIRRLASHQSGLGDDFADRHYTSTTHFRELDSAYRHIRNERLVYPPGSRSVYATGLFTIVGRILERTTGESYPELMRRLVFEPAAMRRTLPNDPRSPPPKRVTFYVRDDGRVRKAPAADPSFKLPGAGFLSTAEDLAWFGSALLQPKFLSEAAREEMFRPVPLTDGTPTEYALGFQSLTENGRRVLLQPGGGLGIAGWLAIYPERRVVVAILSNLTGSSLGGGPRRAVAESFLR
jgi:serine beta-lactamase-like protein LACTB, mitochondrial